jgi:spore germination protein KA
MNKEKWVRVMNKVIYDHIKSKLDGSFDVKYRKISYNQGEILLVFVDNMVDSKFISEYIVAPLIEIDCEIESVNTVKERILKANIIGNVKDEKDAVAQIISGNLVILFSNFDEVIYCEARGFPKRSITIPSTENVIKGPREGFTEVFVDNVSMIRRKIKNPDLKFENITVGQKSNTVVVIVYIKGVTPEPLLNSVRNTIVRIRDEFILDTNYIEEQLGGKKSMFNTVSYTEKPDVMASKIMEGRVGIFVDGSPFGITVPNFFVENFQAPDDYYMNKFYSNVTRWLRLTAFFISVFLPGLYIAFITYHFPLIPSVFIFRLAVSRAGVPFPTVVEVFLMMTFFQLIKEAGVRLPQPIGQAMSIVGALILGDAAIGAGLASQSTVLIVALASICYFLIPKLYSGSAIWSVILLFFGALLGLPGFYIGFFVFITHLAGLKSNGYPFMYPLGTLHMFKYRDILYRKNLSEISNNLFDEDDAK